MKAAKLQNSARLQRVDALLADGNPHSTMEIIERAHVCAVNSIIGELRENGRIINCQKVHGVFFYQLEA